MTAYDAAVRPFDRLRAQNVVKPSTPLRLDPEPSRGAAPSVGQAPRISCGSGSQFVGTPGNLGRTRIAWPHRQFVEIAESTVKKHLQHIIKKTGAGLA